MELDAQALEKARDDRLDSDTLVILAPFLFQGAANAEVLEHLHVLLTIF